MELNCAPKSKARIFKRDHGIVGTGVYLRWLSVPAKVSALAETSLSAWGYPEVMNARFPVAAAAALIADPARAAILIVLLDGRAFAAGELARVADISAQSASMHLAQLLQGGFVKVAAEGRHRYYRIASPEVAHAVEALGVIASPRKQKPVGESDAMRYARTCYDHLAGEMAVKLTGAWERRGMIVARGTRDYDLTPRGEAFLAQWEIDVAALRAARRIFARRCLDWTERRDHLAGAVGAAICQKFFDFRWIVRERNTRVVCLTASGRTQLQELLDQVAA